ncbi:MAG: helix-turn-helix domain-containing protein [candidate division WS1 bacterium]|jgi:DNA-binding transcriptional ArsR family regulator|nr:helix-turn-helix domain-containing protein [candidate division WS1 bacterium]
MKRTLASLAEVLWPVGRARILGLLLGQPDETWHLREIARRTGLAPATVQREIASLARAGILTRQRQGNQVYYQANRACAVFPELHSLALKTAGLADVLRQVLQPLGDRLGLAAVFGSLAAGTAHGDSDVDLLLIGDLTLRELSAPLAEAERTLGREINPVVMTREELQERLGEGEHFAVSVMRSPLLLLKGTEHELAELGPGAATEAAPDLQERDQPAPGAGG